MEKGHETKSGWFGNSRKHASVGRKGGLVTAKKGMNYFKEIGRLGGLKRKKKNKY